MYTSISDVCMVFAAGTVFLFVSLGLKWNAMPHPPTSQTICHACWSDRWRNVVFGIRAGGFCEVCSDPDRRQKTSRTRSSAGQKKRWSQGKRWALSLETARIFGSWYTRTSSWRTGELAITCSLLVIRVNALHICILKPPPRVDVNPFGLSHLSYRNALTIGLLYVFIFVWVKMIAI